MQSFILELWRGLLTSMAFADGQDFSVNKTTHSSLHSSMKDYRIAARVCTNC